LHQLVWTRPVCLFFRLTMIVGKIGPRVYLPSTSKAPNINRMLSSKVTLVFIAT
jgi:hypothetical protein